MSFGAVAGGLAAAVGGAVATSALSGGSSGGGAASAADPFGNWRQYYAGQLSDFMSNPTSYVQSTPGYEFGLTTGTNQVEGSAAARGMLNSGNTLAAVQKYGEDYANTSYNNYLQTLMQLSGANTGNPGMAGQILSNQNQMNQQSASALGNQLGNVVGNGVSSLFNGSAPANGSGTTWGGTGSVTPYNFNSGVSDPSYGVSGGGFGG